MSRCVCASMPPGRMYFPVASIVRSHGPGGAALGPKMAAILSSTIATSAAYVSTAVTTVPPLMSVRVIGRSSVSLADDVDHSATRTRAGVSGRLRRPVIGTLVEDDRASHDGERAGIRLHRVARHREDERAGAGLVDGDVAHVARVMRRGVGVPMAGVARVEVTAREHRDATVGIVSA